MALSASLVRFRVNPANVLLIVGSAVNVSLHPRKCTAAYISVYYFYEEGKKINLVYKVPVEDIPLSFVEFDGKLLAGIGNILRMYDLGIKKLLKKCENKMFSNGINNIVVN